MPRTATALVFELTVGDGTFNSPPDTVRVTVFPLGAPVCLDADGDGFGLPASPDCPAGLVSDFDDMASSVYPGAPEVNDGLDNQCAGDSGAGSIDELEPALAFGSSGDPDQLSWAAQAGASGYQVQRSTDARFSENCSRFDVTPEQFVDAAVPAPGEVFFYAVRSLTPHAGSFGQDSQGNERVTCN